MVADPAAIPVTLPLLTVAMDDEDVLHVTVVLDALEGRMVAVSSLLPPTVSERALWLSVREVTLVLLPELLLVSSSSLPPHPHKIKMQEIKLTNSFFVFMSLLFLDSVDVGIL